LTGYRIRYRPEAARLIATLPPETKRLLRSAIEALRVNPEKGTDLVGEYLGYRSLHVRRYRVIYRWNELTSSVEVFHVGHRRDVYETLRTLLSGSA